MCYIKRIEEKIKLTLKVNEVCFFFVPNDAYNFFAFPVFIQLNERT